jgi:chaperone required for assembly of F1-ATPase
MKRFYKQVSVSEARGIMLDAKPVRTPRKALLILPTDAMAAAVAEEWRMQGDRIDPHMMKITGLANAAIDVITPDTGSFAARLAAYGESDVLCYRASDPPDLVARQMGAWEPILGWAQARYDVDFARISGIMHQPQPAQTLLRLAAEIGKCSPFELSAMSHIVTISGSLVIALAVLEGAIAEDVAFDAAHLDELWQVEKWGEDSFATQAREAHRTDFRSACRFLHLLNG